MHRPLLCGATCVRGCVCLCVESQLSSVKLASRLSQRQPALTGMGERVSLTQSRHATPRPRTYVMEKHVRLAEREGAYCVMCSQTGKYDVFFTINTRSYSGLCSGFLNFETLYVRPCLLASNYIWIWLLHCRFVEILAINKWSGINQAFIRETWQAGLEKTTCVNMRKWKASYMHAICARSSLVGALQSP